MVVVVVSMLQAIEIVESRVVRSLINWLVLLLLMALLRVCCCCSCARLSPRERCPPMELWQQCCSHLHEQWGR
jgi:hypothetical protein